MKKTLLTLLALLLVMSIFASACAPAAPEVPAEEPMEEPMEESGGQLFDGEAPPAAGDELAAALNGEYDGTVVTMSGPFTDADAVKFEESVVAYEEATGIDIQYEGSKEFEASITIRVDGGDAPDIVDFPQPGLLSTMVAKGQVVDLNGVIDTLFLRP